MALLTLTPTSGSPASIQVDEIDIYRVTSYGAGSNVVYSGPSAFLGDQVAVIVNETPAAIAALSTALITLTIGGQSVLVNVFNIFDVVVDPIGSKIMYKEFGLITYLFATEAPSVVKTLVFSATNNTKYNISAAITSTSLSVNQVSAGYIKADTSGGAVALTLPTFANFTSAGYGEGSVITFFVENVSIGSTNAATVTVPGGGNVNFNTLNGTGAVADGATTSLGKFEIVIKSTSATVSRVY